MEVTWNCPRCNAENSDEFDSTMTLECQICRSETRLEDVVPHDELIELIVDERNPYGGYRP